MIQNRLTAVSISSYFSLVVMLELMTVLFANEIVSISALALVNIVCWPIFLRFSFKRCLDQTWCLGLSLLGTHLGVKGFSILMLAINHFDPTSTYQSLGYVSYILGLMVDFLSFIWLYYTMTHVNNGTATEENI